MNKVAQHKKAMIEALEQSLGVVTTACRVAGIGRTTHYKWLREDPEYQQAVEDISGVALDFAESQLHRQIKDGNTAATIFYLKTKGKGRGYIERIENVHEGSVPVNIKEVKTYADNKADKEADTGD